MTNLKERVANIDKLFDEYQRTKSDFMNDKGHSVMSAAYWDDAITDLTEEAPEMALIIREQTRLLELMAERLYNVVHWKVAQPFDIETEKVYYTRFWEMLADWTKETLTEYNKTMGNPTNPERG